MGSEDNADTVDRAVLEKRRERRQTIGVVVMAVGCILAVVTMWMFLQDGGSLITEPSRPMIYYIAPALIAAAMCIYGWWRVLYG